MVKAINSVHCEMHSIYVLGGGSVSLIRNNTGRLVKYAAYDHLAMFDSIRITYLLNVMFRPVQIKHANPMFAIGNKNILRKVLSFKYESSLAEMYIHTGINSNPSLIG